MGTDRKATRQDRWTVVRERHRWREREERAREGERLHNSTEAAMIAHCSII